MVQNELKFKIGEGLDELPTRRYLKGSKYDALIKILQNSKSKYTPVEIENKDANYVRIQLTKRVIALNLTNIKITVANNICYAEKIAK